MLHLLTTSCTIKHRDETGTVTSTEDTGCFLEALMDVQPDGDEPWVVGTETYRRVWSLYLRPQQTITAADRVDVGEFEYDVVDVRRLTNPRTGVEHHVVASVTRVAPGDTTVAIRRPALGGDDYSGATYTTVATGVRAWVTPLYGAESATGGQSVVTFRLQADPCDLRHYDQVVDERTGEVFDVLWVRAVGIAAGRAHVEGELKRVEGSAA